MLTLILDATTDGPRWTAAIAAMITVMCVIFAIRERASARRDRARADRQRSYAEQAAWSPPEEPERT